MGLELLEYLGISIASATVLIVVAKFVLQHLIRREPDYYDKREQAEEKAALENFGKAGAHGHHEPEPVAEAIVEPKPDADLPAKDSKKKTEPKKSASKTTTVKKPATKKPAAKKPRKPSMNMKKDELIAVAKGRGIKVSSKLTKAQILELIQQADK